MRAAAVRRVMSSSSSSLARHARVWVPGRMLASGGGGGGAGGNANTSMDLVSAYGLSEEQRELKGQVHRFCQAELAPIADRVDKSNAFPQEMWQKFGALGVLGVTVAPEYGGLGLGYLEHAFIMEEVSRASGSVALSYGAHSNLCVNQIHRNGTAEQKAKYLPGLVAGELVGALAMSETGSGSDVMSLKLTAAPAKGGYVLNGAKYWITNGPDAHIIVVYAKVDGRVTAFIVDTRTSPVGRGPKLDKLGMRGSNTGELEFRDCFVPAENVLGQVGGGGRVLMSGLDYERLVLSGGPVGLSQAALDVALPYTHERRQFGRPIATFELVQGHLADMYAETTACRSYLYAVGRAADSGASGPSLRQSCAALILYTAERATRHGLQAIQLLGGNGYTNEYPAGRIMRDAKLYEIGAGTSEIRRYLVGREFNEASPVEQSALRLTDAILTETQAFGIKEQRQ